MNTRVLVRAIRAWRGDDRGPLIVITVLPTPLARAVIRELAPAVVVYYCIDRLAESSPGAAQVIHSERKLLVEADLVLVTSRALYEMAAEVAPRVELMASGVGVERFEHARRSRAEAFGTLAALPRPIVGYVGSLRHVTDLGLLSRVAQLAPDLQFVFVGPRFVNVKPLAAQPNVRLFGAIAHDDAVQYMVRFDAGIPP